MEKIQLPTDYPLDSIEHTIAGEAGTPVLFLHGWGGNNNTLNALSQPISVHRKTVSLSLPGFGKSLEPPESWGTWDYVEIVLKWLKLRGSEKVDIIGHSFGGRVAIGLAHRYPQSVNQLVLIGSAGLTLPKGSKVIAKLVLAHSINRIGNLVGGEIKKNLQAKKKKMGSADWQAASPNMRRILSRVISEDLSVKLKEIRSKTLLLWGLDDSAVPVKLARRMNELIPDSKLVVLPNAGHYPFIDQPGKTLNEVWDWLELPSVW